MLRNSSVTVALWLGLCLWFSKPQPAAALFVAQVGRGGVTYIGEISDGTSSFPIAWTSIDDVSCSTPDSVPLFDRTRGGALPPGLNDNVELRGSADGGFIVLVSSPMVRFCNTPWTLNPLRTNFFTLTVLAQGGVDWIEGGPTPGKVLRGGGGDDLISYPGSSILNPVYGDGGNDLIIGDGGDYLNGNAGDDLFCVAPRTTAASVVGGTGNDRLCGAASMRSSVTTLSSSACSSACAVF